MAEPLAPKTEGRFARFEAIEWWDQRRLDAARVLVVGAGALGNEVLKNLALLGVGHVLVVDLDTIEESNLTRSVLFRGDHCGEPKATVAAAAYREIFPRARTAAVVGHAGADLGLGAFAWADVVVGALDNREARVFLNSCCALTDTPWFDGGLDVFNGIVRGFHGPRTACYECTMSKVDWDLINQRRSCSLLTRRAEENDGAPTTPTIASVIGGLQAAEVVKQLHGMDAMLGRGFVVEGLHHSSYPVTYPVQPQSGRTG